MGRSSRGVIRDPRQIVIEKGRVYRYKKRYIQVVVFSIWVTEVRALAYEFGGHIYRHGTGHIWLLANRDSLVELVNKCEHLFPSKNNFEVPIQEQYMRKEARH